MSDASSKPPEITPEQHARRVSRFPQSCTVDSREGCLNYAIIAGYGPVGRAVGQSLENQGIEVTVIELNEATVERQAERGKTFVFGDATDPETLLTAGIRHAQVLVVAIPNEDAACRACAAARALNPELFILARANFLSKGMLCTQAGADRVVVEELVTAQAMHDVVMRELQARSG